MADGLASDAREYLKDLDCWADAAYQFPIAVSISLEGHFSIMEELEDCLERIGLFESDSKGGLREVCPSNFGIVGQGSIDD